MSGARQNPFCEIGENLKSLRSHCNQLSRMESEKYRKFLKQQAEKNPVKIEGSLVGQRFRISWEDERDRTTLDSSSDLLDSLYLGKDMQETVVVDRKTAAMLQDRLRGLEEENIRVRKRMRLMKFIIGALLVGVALVSLAFINTNYLQIRIMP